jgi:all-trans-retinol 13,14-reductase
MVTDRAALVVIGGGLTGLSSALTWALHRDPDRAPVLVVEEQRVLGGCVASFRRQGFLFDTAQLVPDVSELLAYLGVKLPTLSFGDVFARIVLVDARERSRTVVSIPTGVDRFRALLTERYPHQRQALARFFRLAGAIFEELRQLKVEPRWYELPLLCLRCRHVVGAAALTFRELVANCGIRDPELIDIFDVFAAFSGMPAERVAALMTVSAMMTSLAGSFRPAAGFVALPYAFKRRLEELGGTVWTRQRVTRILVRDGRACGVELADGRTIAAEHVISTVDPVVAMRDLVGLDTVRRLDPGYAARIESLRMSASSLHISLGLDDGIDLRGLGLDGGYNVISTGRGAFARLFAAFDQGRLGHSPECFHTAVICPSLLIGGKPTVVIRVVPVPMADWGTLRASEPRAYADRKRALADFYIEQVERYAIPDLRRHIQVMDVATPATFARFTGTLHGQNYDMAPSPDNFGRKRLAMRTPVAGLLQPKLCHGIWPAITGGMQAVDMILAGEVMGGYSRYSPRRDPSAPRSGVGSC